MSVKPGGNEYECLRFIQTIPTGAVLSILCIEITSAIKIYIASSVMCGRWNYSAVLN